MSPDYTIGIPHHNDERNLLALLENIEQQQIDFKLKVLVYDDFSKDTLQIDKVFHNFDLEVIKGRKNLGPGLARNKLIDLSPTKNLLMIDSDCKFTGEESLSHFYEVRDKADISYPNIYEKSGRFSSVIHPQKDQKFPTMTTCFQMNKEVLKSKMIKFRNIFDFFCEDFCFFIECQKRGLSMLHLADLTINHQRPTTGKCPVRFTRQKKLNLVKSFILVRLLHPGFVQSTWYTKDHIFSVIKENKKLKVKTIEYAAIMDTFFRLPLSLHKVLIQKLIYVYENILIRIKN